MFQIRLWIQLMPKLPMKEHESSCPVAVRCSPHQRPVRFESPPGLGGYAAIFRFSMVKKMVKCSSQ